MGEDERESGFREALRRLDLGLLAQIIRACEEHQRNSGRFPTPEQVQRIVEAGR